MSGERRLQIYVAAHCVGLERALSLAGDVRKLRPHWEVDVVELDNLQGEPPAFVVATPMYAAGNCPLFWGNPSLNTLMTRLDALEQDA